MADSKRPIMVMAGGTGGHVFPALAVANYLRDKGEDIIWMGTKSGLESRIVPAANFPIEWLTIEGVRGKGLITKAMAPFKLILACTQAVKLLRKNKPRAVLGMGGFASGPGGVMAWLLRIPLIIHEQNAVLGLTNKLLHRLASLKYFAFPQAAKNIKDSIVVGNPVRNELLEIDPPELRLSKRKQKNINVLVIGGSLGAKTLNDIVPLAIKNIESSLRPNIRHQCGSGKLLNCQSLYEKFGIEADVTEFVEDMKSAYEWSDLVICRSGALTIAELAAVGVASILVPYPHHVDDQQLFNAAFLTDAEAAIVRLDKEFTAEFLADCLLNLTEHREKLLKMACNARKVAYTDATRQVASGILQEAL
ncbi:MAG: undecaprenyldiphospho-muramoylpentapeptide beta-N-acetylglucosaminyltransferase [Gammaproteobacteria bacterium]|nr:undecaprenyldiphospho-muramoylpentapeptide beta-N-acetylglucosaminyltransferase [Gammaproteobacteria bacterium]